MAVGINVLKEDVETLSTKITLSGLTVGTRYDVMRLQLQCPGKDEDGERIYERILPDRRALWSSVAHRVGWEATATTHTFRDFECPKRPTQYYVVASTAIGPYEWDFADGTYPISNGVMDDEIVHFAGDIADLRAAMGEEPDKGHILVRSMHELAHYADVCLVEMDGPTYTARAEEFAVLRSQYPVVISDSRESRRGRVTLMTREIGDYQDLRRIVFPESGRIRPFMMHSGEDALLIDDMRCVPMDVEVEQAWQGSADLRYVHIDYIEIDPTAKLFQRVGDNDLLTDPPESNFTISDTTPARNQWVTLTDASTGQGDTWEWTVGHATFESDWIGKRYTSGGVSGHKVYWPRRGRKEIKLRFGGSGEGFHTRVKHVEVH